MDEFMINETVAEISDYVRSCTSMDDLDESTLYFIIENHINHYIGE